MQRILGGTRRAVYRVGALLVLLAGGAALLTPEHRNTLLVLHAVWAAAVFGAGELVGRNVLSAAAGGRASSAVGVLVLPAIVHLSVGPGVHVVYPVLVAMPLIVAAMAPDDRASVLVFFGGGLLWIVLLDQAAGVGRMETLGRFVVAVACGGIAVAATYAQERTRRAEKHAVDARVAALRRLADSERRRMEAERLAVIGTVASGTAHEINNPLMVVLGNLGYMRAQLAARNALDQDTAELLDDVSGAVARIRQVVLGMAHFARPEAEGEAAAAPPHAAIQQAFQVVAARTRQAVMENAVPVDAPAVGLHPSRLVHVLVNLLLNAADSLETAALPPEKRKIRVALAQAPAGQLALVVEDSGPGFSPEVLTHAFDPFFTTKAAGAGSGLGLSLCKEYVTGAGGTISADNLPTGGACVTVVLPVARDPEPRPSL